MMTSNQIIHVGMINSYNIITGKASLEEVMMSGISYLAHAPDDLEAGQLELIIFYFEEMEMYEICHELRKIYEENYHPDGTPKELDCLCDTPVIEKYTRNMRCGTCNNRLRK
jgi:hypothetical protein